MTDLGTLFSAYSCVGYGEEDVTANGSVIYTVPFRHFSCFILFLLSISLIPRQRWLSLVATGTSANLTLTTKFLHRRYNTQQQNNFAKRGISRISHCFVQASLAN